MNRTPDHIGLAAVDGTIALALTAGAISYAHHSAQSSFTLLSRGVSFNDAIFGLTFVVLWQYCFSVLKLYDRFATLPSRMAAIFKGVATMMIPVAIHLMVYHRHLVDLRTILYIFAVLFAYEVDRIWLRDLFFDRILAQNPQNVVIIGSGRRAAKAWREIRTRYHSSVTVLGFVDDRSPSEMAPDIAARHLGRIDDLGNLLLVNTVDSVVVAMPIQSSYPLMQKAVSIAEEVGLRVFYLNDIYSTNRRQEQPNRELFQELFPHTEHHLLRLAVKRILDVVVASILLVALSPLLVCVALAVKLTSEGPAFFCQERFGFKRRTFKMIKFRSMVKDAEARLAELESLNELSGPIFKMKRDPRVTPLGRILRSTSIDELPQLWNVLKGDMSLVGPRPMSMRDVSLFSEAALMRRFSVKPGITGLWQVQGRSNVGFDEWVALDSRYIDHWSLLLDFKILVRTISAVVKGSGAA